MKARRFLASALVVLAGAAWAGADDAPPKIELPGGPLVRPGRPLRLRVVGGADRVRGPGTPWALPQGDRGDEFVLQLPVAVETPLVVTVRRAESTSLVRVDADLRPPDDADARRDPLSAPPDPAAYSATAEAVAAVPLLRSGERNVLLLLAATQTALVFLGRRRRDKPWVRAAWLCGPAVAAVVFWTATTTRGAALRAVAVAVDDGRGRTVYVRVDALRDGAGALVLPPSARDAAVVRWDAADVALDDVAVGPRIELSLSAGRTRVFAYRIDGADAAPEAASAPPISLRSGSRLAAWLREAGLDPAAARVEVRDSVLPQGRGVDVLPGLAATVAPAK